MPTREEMEQAAKLAKQVEEFVLAKFASVGVSPIRGNG
jgi:hypothetical protein